MASTLETVSKTILEPSELELQQLGGFLDGLQCKYIDAGDLYFQTSQQESWVMDDGILREGSFSIEKGVGIRAMSEEKTGFAYCDDLRGNAITHDPVGMLAVKLTALREPANTDQQDDKDNDR